MPERLTVLITCKNEERNIGACIKSAQSIADEMLVADSGSEDATMAIARELGARIIEREYINPASFKNWAIPQAEHYWVLVIDADERVTAELADEIRTLLQKTPPCDGYRIYRRNHIYGREVKHSGWNRDDVLRLFRRDVARYKDVWVHEEVEVDTGRIGVLRHRFLHYTYWSLDDWSAKIERYAAWGAQDLRNRGRRASRMHLLFRPMARFVRHFIFRLGFLDGTLGVLISYMAAHYVFLKYAKLWEMEQKEQAERDAHDA
jgi:glycosyltransferase involved in cell wall biosynthesis